MAYAGELCLECGRPYQVRCRCPLGDMTCPEGHNWHHCPSCGKTIAGPADHTRPLDAHRCRDCRGQPLTVSEA
jgi:hypothetical protein